MVDGLHIFIGNRTKKPLKLVVHAHNPNYSGGRDEDLGSKSSITKKNG
jgi:hypothetical protein